MVKAKNSQHGFLKKNRPFGKAKISPAPSNIFSSPLQKSQEQEELPSGE
jgi:hypothetical protein